MYDGCLGAELRQREAAANGAAIVGPPHLGLVFVRAELRQIKTEFTKNKLCNRQRFLGLRFEGHCYSLCVMIGKRIRTTLTDSWNLIFNIDH